MSDAAAWLSRLGADRGKLSRRGRRRALGRNQRRCRANSSTTRAARPCSSKSASAGVLSDPHRDRDPRTVAGESPPASVALPGSSSWAAAPASRYASCCGARVAGRLCPGDIARAPAPRRGATGARFPELPVVAVCADYTRPFRCRRFPDPRASGSGFFRARPSVISRRTAVVRFLCHCTELLGPGCEMLIGADLKKAPEILDAAYNDRAGVNAAFNLNLLVRINRELGGNIDIDRFAHVAFTTLKQGRMELYLKSLPSRRSRSPIAASSLLTANLFIRKIHTNTRLRSSARLLPAPASLSYIPGPTPTSCSASTISGGNRRRRPARE